VGKRERPKSSDTFETEVSRQFGPLATRWGMEGPEEDGVVLPTVKYTLDRLTYEWMLDPRDAAVSVSVGLVVAGGTLSAWLEEIVKGAGLGPVQAVRGSARTWHSLQTAVASHVAWLERLHPTLSGPGAEEFLERMGARKFTPDLD
jgi:hypothetical protein